ncbi:MAG: protocatechuate 4,5-dioxygenase subunit alpha [Alphaproteobacteria bacterium]|nr:protocatechuate 4,5-dioxygenase subunit alpha [Alphaproteobacteria bacterium]
MSYLDDKTPIPGTIMFDGQKSRMGYGLNKMCYSFNDESARNEFTADENAYCTKYKLSDEQKKAVKDRDIIALLELGGSIYYLAKFAGILKLNMQGIGALQTGLTLEEFKQKLVDAGK